MANPPGQLIQSADSWRTTNSSSPPEDCFLNGTYSDGYYCGFRNPRRARPDYESPAGLLAVASTEELPDLSFPKTSSGPVPGPFGSAPKRRRWCYKGQEWWRNPMKRWLARTVHREW